MVVAGSEASLAARLPTAGLLALASVNSLHKRARGSGEMVGAGLSGHCFKS